MAKYPIVKKANIWWKNTWSIVGPIGKLERYANYPLPIVQYSQKRGQVYVKGTRFNFGLDEQGGAWFDIIKDSNRWVMSNPGEPHITPKKEWPGMEKDLLKIRGF